MFPFYLLCMCIVCRAIHEICEAPGSIFLMDLAVSISSDPNENVSTILVVQFQAILSKSSFLNYLLASLCSEI